MEKYLIFMQECYIFALFRRYPINEYEVYL